ncbi:hypothetical protein Tco_1469091 [Tanacetum coccineum]
MVARLGMILKGTNVVSFDELFPLLNTSRNSIGGRPEVVKDAMYSSFMDPKVVEQVEEPMSTIPKSFVSLVTNETVTCKRVAFPVVENFVKNVWKKFGLVHVMMNSKGFFFSSLLQLRDIPIVSFTVDGLSMMDTKLGNPPMLIRDMVIDIPNVEDDGEVIHMVRVEYEWEPPRCSVCMVFGHDDMLCLKRHVEKLKKQHTNHDGFQHTSYSHGTNVGSKVMSLDQGGSSNSSKKVFQDVVGSASDSPSNTPLVARINELESQMIEGKLVLLDEDGNSLKTSKSTLPSSSSVVSKKVDDLVNEDNDSKIEEENHGEGSYDDDDFDNPVLPDAQMKFANTFDINLHGQLR